MIGKNIKLRGKTQKGKNRIRENGEFWTVLAATDHVLFSPDKKGPWVFIAPMGRKQDDKAARWVHTTDDVDFVVDVLEVDNTLD